MKSTTLRTVSYLLIKSQCVTRLSRVSACLLVLCLTVSSWSLPIFTQTPPQLGVPLDQATRERKIAQAKKQARAVRTVHKLLRDANAPFDPHILFSRVWRKKLAPIFDAMPEMQQVKVHSGTLKGVHFAHTLYLPEQVELADDTVIVARYIVYQGRNTVIKGPHSLHMFIVNSTTTAGGAGGKVTIDISGLGRNEWLKSKAAQKAAVSKTPVKFTNAAFTSSSARNVAASLLQDYSGAPGADGSNGVAGNPGGAGTEGARGIDGSCGGSPNGGDGGSGDVGKNGEDGKNATSGRSGNNGNDHTIDITDPNDQTAYEITSKGGNGGNGGNGGDGGLGGTGGRGGNGGDGANCQCGGSGGHGGNGGAGGAGGGGGLGGDGGDGGNGGTITINYPQGYNPSSHVTTHLDGGAAGGAGQGGGVGSGGNGGDRGRGGKAGSGFSCYGNAGQDGAGGVYGQNGSPGASGNPGKIGQNGQVVRNVTGGGDGDGGVLEPGGSGDGGCTEYWWVLYVNDCEYAGVPRKENIEKVGYPSITPKKKYSVLEDCGWREVNRWYAGCW
jgi:hypothetical protein